MNEFDRYPRGEFSADNSRKLDALNVLRAKRVSALIELLFDGLNKAAVIALLMALLKVATQLDDLHLSWAGAFMITAWAWFKVLPYTIKKSGLLKVRNEREYWTTAARFFVTHFFLCLFLALVAATGLAAALKQLPASPNG